jgi:hypothetical protein
MTIPYESICIMINLNHDPSDCPYPTSCYYMFSVYYAYSNGPQKNTLKISHNAYNVNIVKVGDTYTGNIRQGGYDYFMI